MVRLCHILKACLNVAIATREHVGDRDDASLSARRIVFFGCIYPSHLEGRLVKILVLGLRDIFS